MAYETSYDVGLKPFSHDKHRGKWASPKDFFFACIGHAFKIDAMFVLPSLVLQESGMYALIPYAIIMMACTIPIVFIQSFLGQFSSSGFISVFRIAPLFKGVGYVSLVINLMTLTYYSIFAAIPLFYFFNSIRPTLPWSCDHEPNWVPDEVNGTTICHIIINQTSIEDFTFLQLPSQKFFTDHLETAKREGFITHSYSWLLFTCTALIWLSAWVVLKKPTAMVGRIIRYMSITTLVTISVCALRFAFLPGAFRSSDIFGSIRQFGSSLEAFVMVPIVALAGLGPGWGSILTMASYNNFKTDVTKYTWVLCLGQTGLMIVSGLMWIFIENFLIASNEKLILRHGQSQWMQALSTPTALSFMELPHMWTLLFFGMMTLGALTLLIVQLLSVFTSLFDEYELLRRAKKEVIALTIGVLCVISLLFCSGKGVFAFELLSRYSILTQVFLNLMLLLVVLWVYGRERFQRDVHFMTNRTYSTWMVNVARFVAPIFLLFSFLLGLIIIMVHRASFGIFILVSILISLPWLLIPGYCIFKMAQTSGLLTLRFKRCCRPTDWYPVDPEDRQKYDEMFTEAEINHQLTTTEDDV